MAEREPAVATDSWTCPTCGRVNASDFAVCPNEGTPRTKTTTSDDPLIGEVLGRTYRMTRLLGQGGMARLYEAEHLRIETHYAVKIIHDDLARDPELLVRFEREARAAGKIHSEHVVRLVDVLRTADNRPCLITELLEGEDLQAQLDRVGKLTVAQAIPIARQLCHAVAAAHAVGVVHRDLKPSNVFLCGKERDPLVKVFDFGVAKVEADEKLTRTDAVMGTAAYMAPEQARSAARASPLSDVYAIGAVIYHMLSGQPPYGNVPALSRYALVLHEEPARPRTLEPSIPEGVEAVIQHAMARDPAARIQSALELEAQLAGFDRRPRAQTAPSAPVATPQATEATAQSIEVRARRARPYAALIALASSLAVGAWFAAMLTVIVAPSSSGERALIALIGTSVIAAVAAMHVRALRPRWNSVTAVTRHIEPYRRALGGAVIMLGSLELVTYGSAALLHATPIGIGWRIALTGWAALIGLAWRRWRLDERMRRRIG